MAGQIGDYLRIAAGTVILSGRVAGNVEIAAREIRVEPGAVIGGDLVWRSEQLPQIAEDVHILGELRAADAGAPAGAAAGSSSTAGSFAAALAVAAASLVLLWVAPRLLAQLAATFQVAPVRTLGKGFATLVLTPVVAILLFITMLGWLLGIVVLAGYVFAVLLSGLVGLAIVAHLASVRLQRAAGTASARGWRTVLALVLITMLLVYAQRVPVLGTVLTAFLVLAGLGALVAQLSGSLTGRMPRS